MERLLGCLRVHVTLTFALLGMLVGNSLQGQGLSPSTPSKEFIRVNGQVVAVENSVLNRSMVQIGSPAFWSTYSGQLTIDGWAIDDITPIGSIEIAIDGASFGAAQYGLYRPDVCNVYPNRAGCPNVGWSFLLDTAVLANGSHTVAITAVTSETIPRKTTTRVVFYTNNSGSATPNQSMLQVDAPAAQPTYSGTQTFYGWAIDNTASIAGVGIAIDGISYGSASYGVSRPDVCNVYPGRAGCPNVGWSFSIDTTELDDGFHTLTVTAFTAEAVPRQTTAVLPFYTAN